MAREDPQRMRCYRFEWECIQPLDPSASGAASLLSLPQCREIVEHVFCEFAPDVSPPAVNASVENTDRRKRRQKVRPACFRWGLGPPPLAPVAQYDITLPDWSRSRGTVLHEAAHALTRAFAGAGVGVEGHGPEFMATAMALWRCYLPGFEYEVARKQGVARGIRFAATPPERRVFHWADRPCFLCGTEPPDPRWRSVRDASFRDDAVREEVLSCSTETACLQRIFELELEQPGTVVRGFDYLLRQIKDGVLLPDGHPLRDHIKHHTSPRRYKALSPGPRRTWVRQAIRLLRENG